MKPTYILIVALAAVLAGCGRPPEVRSLSASALPLATNLKTSAEGLQGRFAQQRQALDARADELTVQAALARRQVNGTEGDWRYAGETALPKKLAMLREGDAAIRADPLAAVAPTASITSKPAKLDLGPLNKSLGALDKLRQDRAPNGWELFAFVQSVNSKLTELEAEKGNDAGKAK
jgi:hypothetical protein